MALAALAAVIALFFGPGLVGGKVLLPADVLFAFEPWRSQAAAFGVTLPHNDLIADAVLQNYGWKTLIKESLLHGELPLWNPSILGGVPLLAAGQPGALYPPGLLFFLLLPTAYAYAWFSAAHCFIGGVGMYLYLRRLETGAWGALLGALTFALAGFLVVSLQWPQVVSAAVWLPWLLLCLEWLFVHAEAQAGQRADERAAPWLGMPFWTLLGALAVWLTLLAGHIEIAFYVLFTGGAYGLVRLVLLLRRSGPGDPAAKVLLAGMLLAGTGMLMAAAQLAPFYEVLQQNFRAGAASFDQVAGWALPKRQLLAFLIPDIFGNPTHHHYIDLLSWRQLPVTGATDLDGNARSYIFFGIKNYVEGTGYLGLLPLLLAGAALVLRRDRYTAFFAGFGAFALLLAFGAPLYALFFWGVPGFDQLHSPFRWLFPYACCVAVLAGLGADALIARRDGLAAVVGRRLGRAALIAGGGVLLAVAVSRLALPAALQATTEVYERSKALQLAIADPGILYSYEAVNLALFGALLAASGVALLLARRGGRWPAALMAVLAVDLLAFGWGFVTFSDAALLRAEPPAIRWLREQPGPFRIAVYGASDLMPPNLGQLAGVQDVRGYESIIPQRYAAYWGRMEQPQELRYNRIGHIRDQATLKSPLLDALNVQYILSSAPLDVPGLRLAYHDGVYIYENTRALPRAYAAFSAISAESGDSALDAVAAAGFDPRAQVVLEDRNVPAGAAGLPLQTAQVSSYRATEVVTTVDMPMAGYLVLADAYAPGWQAQDEGGNALPVLRANGLFRAVRLSAGNHTVTFSYFPDSFKLGLYLSFLGAVLWVLIAAYWLWQRLYRERPDTSVAQRVVKNSVTPMAAQLLARAVDLGFAIFMLRLLGPSNYGSYAFAVALIGYFAIVTDFGLGTLLTREVARDRSQAERYLMNSIAARMVLVVVTSPVLLVVALLYHRFFGLPLEAVLTAVLFMVSLLPSGVAGALSAVFSAHEKMEYPAAVTVLTTVIRAGLGVLALVAGWGIVGLGVVSVVASAVTAVVFLALLGRTFFPFRPGLDVRFSWSMVRTAFPLMLNNLLNTIFFRMDILLLQPMRGVEAVGYYSTAYKFIEGLLMVPSFFTLALFPTFARYAHSSRELLMQAYARAVKGLLLVALPIAVGVTIVADQLIILFFGEAYAPAVQTLRLLIWFLPFSYVNGVTQYLLIAVDKQRYLTGAFLLGASFNLAANLIAIPIWGIEGAAAVTVLSEIVLLIPFLRGVYAYAGPLPLGDLGLRAVGAAALMAAVLVLVRDLPIWALVPLGGGVYVAGLLLLRVLDDEDRRLVRRILAR